MAKFGTSSSIGMFATAEDGDGVNVGTGDGPRASRWERDGLTSVGDGDGVSATLKDLTGMDIVDRDRINDDKLSLGGSSLTTYHFFFLLVVFPLESWGWRGSVPPDDISIHRTIILQIINQIEY